MSRIKTQIWMGSIALAELAYSIHAASELHLATSIFMGSAGLMIAWNAGAIWQTDKELDKLLIRLNSLEE